MNWLNEKLRNGNSLPLLNGVLLIVAFALFSNCTSTQPSSALPYYFPQFPVSGTDTTYQTLPEFALTNQENNPVSKASYRGSVFVANFFFTTCKSICPVMNAQLKRVYQTFENDEHIRFLSLTVDPQTDSVVALKAYANYYKARAGKWNFVTGPKAQIYSLAKEGFYLNAQEDPNDPEGFLHSEYLMLVDTAYHVRGVYNGTDSIEVNKLIKDLTILKTEQLSSKP